MMSSFIRVLLLVSSLVIVIVVHPSDAGVTTAKPTSLNEQDERDIKLLEDTLDKLQSLYDYIGKIIATLTGSLKADGKSQAQKTAADKKVEEQLDSLATLHKVFNKVMDKVRARVLAMIDFIKSAGQYNSENEVKRARRFVQSLHDNLQLAMQA